jgi:hypothetical protein
MSCKSLGQPWARWPNEIFIIKLFDVWGIKLLSYIVGVLATTGISFTMPATVKIRV